MDLARMSVRFAVGRPAVIGGSVAVARMSDGGGSNGERRSACDQNELLHELVLVGSTGTLARIVGKMKVGPSAQ
jgi:hypothetical protein